MKRIMGFFILLMIGLVLVGCDDKKVYTLPDLTGKSENQINSEFAGKPYTLVKSYEESDTIPNGIFIRYGDDQAIGDEVTPGKVIKVVISKDQLRLPNLSGKTEYDAIGILTDLFINFEILYEVNNNVPAGQFSRYETGYETNQIVNTIESIDVFIATNDPQLPDLSGKTEAQIVTAMNGLNITYTIQTEKNNSVPAGQFSRFSGDYVAGSYVSSGSSVVVYLALNDPQLPSLVGQSMNQIMAQLNTLGIAYEFIFEPDASVDDDEFSKFGDGFAALDFIEPGVTVVIYIAENDPQLPDFAGKTYDEIVDVIESLGINANFEIETNNEVPHQTFSRYGDGFEIGDYVSEEETVLIYIGYNDPQLPDLSGKNIPQITQALNLLLIGFEFDYVVDDTKEEDSFAYYNEFEAGDFFPSGETVGITLYKNSFTDGDSDLMISKYYENQGDDRAIEIVNISDDVVDLSGYHLAIFSNGSLTVSLSINLSGMLAQGETYVIAHTNANSNFTSNADLLSNNLVFNGNDVIQLRLSNNTYIDTLSSIGASTNYFLDETFSRKSTVTTGTRSFNVNEWTAYIPNYYSILGTYPVVDPVWDNQIDLSLLGKTFGDPTGALVSVSLDYVNDGDTAAFNPGFTGDQRVRFLGVDTPETFPVTQPWGPQGKTYTTNRLNAATSIYLQSDPLLGSTDTYGRHLAYVWIVVNGEYSLLNLELVRLGYSQNYFGETSRLVFQNRYLYRWFQDAERHAIENNLGVWS